MQRKLSKRLLFCFFIRDVAERKGKGSQPTVVTFLPLLSTRRTALQRREREARSCTQNKRQAKFYRSPKNTRRCAINRPRKATPFSKLWDCVIRSGEVAKNIAPNRFDNRKALTRSIYDCRGREFSSCRFILPGFERRDTEKLLLARCTLTNATRNKFIESWFSFSWTFSQTSTWNVVTRDCDSVWLSGTLPFLVFVSKTLNCSKNWYRAFKEPFSTPAEVESNFHN